VTRLGEISPFWGLFTLGNFWVAQFLALWCLQRKCYVLNWTKYGLGFILGDFFTETSGHPVLWQQLLKTWLGGKGRKTADEKKLIHVTKNITTKNLHG
jgi:hypothetical protein